MPKYQILGQSAQDSDNVSADPSRLLNMYRERVMAGGRTDYVLKNVLGQTGKDDIGASSIRAMGSADGKNWAVGGGNLYEVASDGTVTSRGAVADDAETTIDGNYSDTTIVADGRYFVFDGSSISEPSGAAFSDFGSHCYVGGYTVVTERGGKRFQWTAQGDATSFNALHFASAEQVDDNILRAVEFQGNLLLICERSTEVWQISGTGATAFSYVTTRNTGLKDFNLLVRFDDALFFVGNDNRAYLFGAGAASSPAVETSITADTPSHCFYYEDEGHKNCVIRFSDRPAWVFDVTEREWHERSETAAHADWQATTSVRNGSTWLVGNTQGSILELTRNSMDRGGPLYRRIVGHTIYSGNRFTVKKIELLGRMGDHTLDDETDYVYGFGRGFVWEIASGIGWLLSSEPAGEREGNIDLYESSDGARTWRGPTTRSVGKNADYERRMVWRARGQYRQYTPRWDITEPADITLYAQGILE